MNGHGPLDADLERLREIEKLVTLRRDVRIFANTYALLVERDEFGDSPGAWQAYVDIVTDLRTLLGDPVEDIEDWQAGLS